MFIEYYNFIGETMNSKKKDSNAEKVLIALKSFSSREVESNFASFRIKIKSPKNFSDADKVLKRFSSHSNKAAGNTHSIPKKK